MTLADWRCLHSWPAYRRSLFIYRLANEALAKALSCLWHKVRLDEISINHRVHLVHSIKIELKQ